MSWPVPDETADIYGQQNAREGMGGNFPCLSTNESEIRTRFAQAVANGGGTIYLPAGVINITSALPMANFVSYKGSSAATRWGTVNYISGGTIIDGGGGVFNGFEYNPIDLASPYATASLLKASEISGCSIMDLSVRNCAYGMKFGALYQGGITNLVLRNIATYGNSQWGIWAENCDSVDFNHITNFNNVVGQFAFGASGAGYWNYGNSRIGSIISQTAPGSRNSRGMVTFVRKPNSFLNNMTIADCTSIGGSLSPQSIATTLVSGSTSISVPDVSYFAVNTPVFAQSAVGGFATNTPYWVQSVSGTSGVGTITLGAFMGATPVSATLTGAGATLTVSGPCPFEFTTDGGGAHFTALKTSNLDAEAGGVVSFYVQNCSNNSIIDSGYTNNNVYGFASYLNDYSTRFRFPSQCTGNYIDGFVCWTETYSGTLNRPTPGFQYQNDATASYDVSIDSSGVAFFNHDTTGLIRPIGTTRTMQNGVQHLAAGGTISQGGSAVSLQGAAIFSGLCSKSVIMDLDWL